MRRGRKINAERKFFPGYVLVRCDLTDEIYHLIKNTPKVTGFLGADNKPMPISDSEADRIKGQVAEGVERPKAAIRFEIGENVRVADGPFASFNGTVEEVDEFALARQGRGIDLRPRNSGRPRIRPGRKGHVRRRTETPEPTQTARDRHCEERPPGREARGDEAMHAAGAPCGMDCFAFGSQ